MVASATMPAQVMMALHKPFQGTLLKIKWGSKKLLLQDGYNALVGQD